MGMRIVLPLALTCAAALAQTALPDLAPAVRGLFPLGGRAGETTEVRLHGRNLDDVIEITFARPDIRAEVLSSDFFNAAARI
jgi:hypothetical protein